MDWEYKTETVSSNYKVSLLATLLTDGWVLTGVMTKKDNCKAGKCGRDVLLGFRRSITT